MAPDRDQQYDPAPPIPTYEEAVAGGTRDWQQRDLPRSPIDGSGATEGQSLLSSRHTYDSSTPTPSQARGRRPAGYRAPTVETDDESNLFSSDDSDSDSDSETNHVRREMQEMEIDDSGVAGNRSSWGKRIGFSLSLPQWRWRWKWKLPRLPSRGGTTSATDGNGPDAANGTDSETRGVRFSFPKLGSPALFMLIGRLLAILIVLGFLWLVFMSDMFSGMARRMNKGMFDPEQVAGWVRDSMDGGRIRNQLQEYTRFAHLAGTQGDYALMLDTEMLFTKYGLEDVRRDVYHVYLNYPTREGRAVEILGEGGKSLWKAKLEEEDAMHEKEGRQTFSFHAHSKSGDVKGPLIYANYGTRGDFKWLRDQGIDTKGAIAIVRYGGPEEDISLKVKAAESAGFVGCLMYSDPADNTNPDDVLLNGGRRYMPEDGVRRGSVSFTNWIVGDVLTPGWGSKENMPRVKVEQSAALPKIPSLPLGWRDAKHLLKQLEKHGKKVPEGWAGSPAVTSWFTGDHASPIVRLKNEQDEVEKQPIWNVYGKINGDEQGEKKIIIGSHRDSLTFGAAGSQSGLAVMLEVIRIFGLIASRGWRPSRTIEFMSWDAAEYNLVGSTEYVEQNDEALRRDAFAYINLGAAVTGDIFHAAGSPVFGSILREVLSVVNIPGNESLRLLDVWDGRKGQLEPLGMSSDYVAFQDIVGTSSLDIHFNGPGYPVHSNYDNINWTDEMAAPLYVHHKMLAQVLGLLILELANRPIMPFDMTNYADNLGRWVDELEIWTKGNGADGASHAALKLDKLRQAVDEVAMSARDFKKWEQTWENSIVSSNGWEPSGLGKSRCEYNSRMAEFESNLLDAAGIPGRAQFKHVVFGPQEWSTSGKDYFPSIRNAVASGNWTLAQVTVDKVANILKDAANNLNA